MTKSRYSPTGAGLLLAGLAMSHLQARPASAQAPFPSDSSLQALLQQWVGSGRVAGIVVGLLDADGSRRILSAGSSGVAGLPLDGHSVFEIGSLTKLFTATLLADMVRRGEVHLDDPIAKYLPPEVKVPSRNGRVITLLDITTHHSGLPRQPTNFHPRNPADPYEDYSVPQLYDFLDGYQLPRDPGARFEYSNLAMGLLGHALARRAGRTYEELIRSRILAPLKMRETGITLTPVMRAHLLHGYDQLGDTVPNWNWDTSALAAAGSLRSTAVDMLRFAAASLSSKQGEPYEALRNTHVARLMVGQSPSDTTVPPDSIGFNWFVSHHKDRVIALHTGGTFGYRSFLGLDIAARRAVVVLTNSGGENFDVLGMHLLDPAIPLTPTPVKFPVVRAIRAGGLVDGITRYHELRAVPRGTWLFDESQLNSVGYWLSTQARSADAVAIFRLNVEMYPDASNPYDSLGWAYLAVGDTAQAITNYKRAVQLDQKNTGAIAALKRLGAQP